jgi:hypothetical protein
MSFSPDVPRETAASSWKARRPAGRWSGRTTILFVLGASLVCWGVLIGKAVLIF